MAPDQPGLFDVMDAPEITMPVTESVLRPRRLLVEAELTELIVPPRMCVPRILTTTAGAIELRIPKLRTGSFPVTAGTPPDGPSVIRLVMGLSARLFR